MMVASQTHQDKERLFRELQALDQWTSDSENEDGRAERQRAAAQASLKPCKSPVQNCKRKLSKPPSLHDIHVISSDSDSADPQKPSSSRSIHTKKSTSALTAKKPKVHDSKHSKQQPSRMNSTKQQRTWKKRKLEIIPEEKQIFKGMLFWFTPPSDICPVRRMRIGKAIAYGAEWTQEWHPDVDHILVDNEYNMKSVTARLTKDQLMHSKAKIVNHEWLCDSIGFKEVRDETTPRYQVPPEPAPAPPAPAEPTKLPKKPVDPAQEPAYRTGFALPPRYRPINEADSMLEGIVREMRDVAELPLDIEPDESVFQSAENDNGSIIPTERKNPWSSGATSGGSGQKFKGFLCMEKNEGTSNNPNAHTIATLKRMASYYERANDQWRCLAYRKASSILAKQPKMIGTFGEAIKLPMIGRRLAEKIEEIATTSRLRRLDAATAHPDDKLIKLFLGIYQVGPATARQWVEKGFRSLKDLQVKGDLNRNQRIGLEHYEDFQQRIPRSEVRQHAAVVEAAFQKVDSDFEITIGGSYRRGSDDSGDIDIIITKKDAKMWEIRELANGDVIPALQKAGFLKTILSDDKEAGSKMHGASVLPGTTVWRRIDFLYVPWDEFGAALIYFTGNDIFNRSLRLLASRKNMRLNQHGLYADVLRGEGRKKITDGRRVAGQDEKEIFDILGVPYRPPQHRCC